MNRIVQIHIRLAEIKDELDKVREDQEKCIKGAPIGLTINAMNHIFKKEQTLRKERIELIAEKMDFEYESEYLN